MSDIKVVAIVFEDGKPVRLFNDSKCITSAYKWTRYTYCLEEHKESELPEFLKIQAFLLTNEEIKELIK